MVKLIDTHTHVYLPEFADGTWAEKAKEAGVEAVLLPNIDKESIDSMLELSNRWKGFAFPMMGLHPCSVKEDYKEVLDNMHALFSSHTFYGVGEIGLDLYWDKTTLEWQKDAFVTQLHWAIEMGLPVSVHTREATEEALECVESINDRRLRGVFHCFTGTLEQAQRLSKLGFAIGIGGVVTFKNGGIAEWIGELPLEQVVLETDAPYLAPVPFRGKTNEPAYLTYIATKLADVYQMGAEKLSEVTSANARRIFNLP